MSRLTIHLTKREIDDFFATRNLARWNKDLEVYGYLLKNLDRAHALPEYSTRFNYFYQVRRNARWRKEFYALFYSSRGKRTDFGVLLKHLFLKTGKIEASFASKLAATLDPGLPIIDRHVLSYIDRKLPSASKSKQERIALTIELYKEMQAAFGAFLKTKEGKHLLSRFKKEHPGVRMSGMKQLDFVLWQSGGKKNVKKV
jgi:hypothetical protein